MVESSESPECVKTAVTKPKSTKDILATHTTELLQWLEAHPIIISKNNQTNGETLRILKQFNDLDWNINFCVEIAKTFKYDQRGTFAGIFQKCQISMSDFTEQEQKALCDKLLFFIKCSCWLRNIKFEAL